MVTLEELVGLQKFTGATDNELIVEWFKQNDLALEGLEMVYNLAKKKIEDDAWKKHLLLDDLRMFGPTKELSDTFGVEDAFKLTNLILHWIISNREGEDFVNVYKDSMPWIKEKVESVNQPHVFWQPFTRWLNSQGIYFKDQKKE